MAKETYMAKEAHAYGHISEACVSVKRDLFVWQKRPIWQKRPMDMGIFDERDLILQKKDLKMRKRDLLVWQKRPIHMGIYLRYA